MDSHRYAEALTAGGRIQIGQGSRLTHPRRAVAASRPTGPAPSSDALDPHGVRPCLVGDVEVDRHGHRRPAAASWSLDGLLLARGRSPSPRPPPATTASGRVELRSLHRRAGVAAGSPCRRATTASPSRCTARSAGRSPLADDGVDVDVIESIVDSGAGAAAGRRARRHR